MTARLRVVSYQGVSGEWDDFVRRQAGWTHYHLYGWKHVMENVFGHECTYLMARSVDDSPIGILPLVRVRSLLFGDYLVSMPFLNYGGPLGTGEALQGLVDHGVRSAALRRHSLVELRARHPQPLDLPVSHRKITVLLDLPREPATAWQHLPAKVRSQIRRPQRAGATVRFGADQIETFFQIFARHMRDLGTPTQSRRFFEAITETFPDDVRFGCVYLRGRPAAVGCGIRWNGEFELGWASACREYSREAPNMLLYWSFIERAIDEGVSVFNFGRCTPGGGTHRFKRQWGGRDEPLSWYHRPSGEVLSVPSPEDESYALAIRLWRRLPLPVTNALGPRIVRFLP